MKNYILAALAMAAMTACQHSEIPSENKEENQSAAQGECRVSFSPFVFTLEQGNINAWQKSRAGALEELATTLSYWDYMEGEELAKNTVTLPSPVDMTLRYGEHCIYFLAHSSSPAPQVSSDMQFTPEKVTETFWKDFRLTADENLEHDQTVKLERVVSKAMVTLKDAMPANVKSMRLTVGSHLRTLDLFTGNGDAESAAEYTLKWDISEEYAGRTGLSFSAYTFTPTAEEEFNVTLKIEALAADGKVLHSAEASQVPLLRNRCTNASCRLFTTNAGMTFGSPDDWNPAKEIEF